MILQSQRNRRIVGKSRNPDDCCKQMRDAGPSAMLATAAAPLVEVPVVHGVIEPLIAPSSVVVVASAITPSPEFQRPHDPPHLHPFPLLV